MNNQIPHYQVNEFFEKKNKYCMCIFVINEGEKLLNQLKVMQPICNGIVDVMVADGGSTDGSTDHDKLKELNVNTLLVKQDTGKLGTQMRMAFDWALKRGYEGIIVADGNGKDGMDAIPRFAEELDKGVDHVQGSRFIPGGHHENTPRSRFWGLKLLHAPLMRLASGFHYTDTTNGFRAYSAKFLSDENVQVFRDCFSGYELHYYLAIRAANLGFRCSEIPVSRVYPANGKVPTKISGLKGNANVIGKLFLSCAGYYNPEGFQKYWELAKLVLLPILLILGACFLYQDYYNNSLEIHSDQYFHNAENFSESLVVPARAKDYAEGEISWWHNLYWGPEVKRDYIRKDHPYFRQVGLQGMAAGFVYKCFSSNDAPAEQRVETTRKIFVVFSVAVFLIVLLWAWHEFGMLTAVAGFFVFLYSPWLVAFVRNLYWVPGTYLLPFCCVVLYFWNGEKKSKKSLILGSIALFSAFLARFCCGYEFMSCVFFAAFVPLTYYAVKFQWSWGRYIAHTVAAAAAGLAAFLASFMILFLQQKAIMNFTFSQSFEALKDNVMYRTGIGSNNVGAVLFDSFLAPLNDVFYTYFFTKTPVVFDWHYISVTLLFIWAVAGFFLINLSRQGNLVNAENRKSFAFLVAGCLAFLAPLSWLLLAKGHAYIHTFIVFFIFSLPAIPFMLMAVAYFIVSSFSCAVKSFFQKKMYSFLLLVLFLSVPLVCLAWNYFDYSGYFVVGRAIAAKPDLQTDHFCFGKHGRKLYIVSKPNADLEAKFIMHLIRPDKTIKNEDFTWEEREVSLPFYAPFRIVAIEIPPFVYDRVDFGQYIQTPDKKIKILWSRSIQLPSINNPPIYNLTDGNWKNGISRTRKCVLFKGYSLSELGILVGKNIKLSNNQNCTITKLYPVPNSDYVEAHFE